MKKDMERQEFKGEWKDAFNQAEVNPSDGVWTNIELDLEKAEGDKMKRSVLFYKLMAAASVVFGMCIAGIGGFYYGEQQANSRIAASTQVTESVIVQSEEDLNSKTLANVNSHNGSELSKEEINVNGAKAHRSAKVLTNDLLVDGSTENINSTRVMSRSSAHQVDPKGTSVVVDTSSKLEDRNAVAAKNNNGSSSIQTIDDYTQVTAGSRYGKYALQVGTNAIDNSNITSSDLWQTDDDLIKKKLPALTHINKIELQLLKEEQPDPVAVMMARLEQREKELANDEDVKKEKKEKGDEQLWTSLGLAAGSFSSANTNVKSSSANSFSASNKVADNQSKASGNTYSMGLNVGTKISSRWVVQGGVNYLKQSSAYEANAVVGTADLQNFRAASLNDVTAKADSKSDKLVGTADYNVNNSLQFVSVPVQAGYVALNKTVAIQINAGVSTDLFIQNTIAPENSNLEKVTQGRGNESPYRPVNFSGLFGTELSYRMGKHYRLALNPGLRYPINSIYKSNTGVSSNPLTMDVGMRFRYIFH